MRKNTLAALGVALALGWAWAQDGAKVYTANCSGCHQVTGQGIPGVFPPLAGHIPEILAKDGGRDYLIKMMLYGVQGAMKIKGMNYNGVMPAFAQLKDEEIAAVLNHISTAWGNKPPAGFKEFTAAEVKAARANRLTQQQVYDLRKKLGL